MSAFSAEHKIQAFWGALGIICMTGAAPLRVAAADATAAPSAAVNDFALDADLGGVPSPYTQTLVQIIRHGSSPDAKASGKLQLRCLTTPGNDVYIGVEQIMTVNAPFSRVAEIMDDIDHYKELFRDFKDIHVVSRERNKLRVYWEQSIPLFFVPNVKYEMLYLIDSPSTDRRTYRYQLAKKSDLKSSDGFVQISKADDSHTLYAEYDFFDADWGAMAILGKEKIWRESLKGLAFSDLAIRIKAENPSWTYSNVRNETEHELDQQPIDSCIRESKPFTQVP